MSCFQRPVRGLLRETGVTRQKPRPQPDSADSDEREAFQKKRKKVATLDENYTVITLNQKRMTVRADLTYGWFLVGMHPTVEVSVSLVLVVQEFIDMVTRPACRVFEVRQAVPAYRPPVDRYRRYVSTKLT